MYILVTLLTCLGKAGGKSGTFRKQLAVICKGHVHSLHCCYGNNHGSMHWWESRMQRYNGFYGDGYANLTSTVFLSKRKIKAAKIVGKSIDAEILPSGPSAKGWSPKGRRGKENTSPAKQQVGFKPGTFWSTGECFNHLSTVSLHCVSSTSMISLASSQKSSLVCTNSLTSCFGSLLCSWCNWSAAWVLSTDSSRHHCSGKTACRKLCYWVTCIHPIQWELG